MIAISSFAGIASFAEIAHCILDHLFRNRARDVFEDFLHLINGRWFLSAHINHCIELEEIIKRNDVGAV